MKVSLFLSFVVAGTMFAQSQPAAPKAKPAATKAPVTAAKPKPAQTAKPSAPATSATPAAPAAASTTGDDKVVLTIGSEKVTARDFNAFIESIPEQYREQARGPAKRQVAEEIIRLKLLAGEARKRGIDKEQSMQSRIAFNVESILARAAFNDILGKTSVDEAATRKYYEEHKGEFENVEASHILVKFKGSPVPAREGQKELTEEEALAKAQEVRKRLQGGEDFAAVAKAESDDTGSGANGGALGTFQRGQMVPAFEQVAFSLPVNQLSEPVKTQFGYHIIRVTKHETKDFAEVKPELEQKLKPEMARESVEKLRKETNVVIDESFFGPEKPAAPVVGATAAPGTPAAPAK